MPGPMRACTFRPWSHRRIVRAVTRDRSPNSISHCTIRPLPFSRTFQATVLVTMFSPITLKGKLPQSTVVRSVTAQLSRSWTEDWIPTRGPTMALAESILTEARDPVRPAIPDTDSPLRNREDPKPAAPATWVRTIRNWRYTTSPSTVSSMLRRVMSGTWMFPVRHGTRGITARLLVQPVICRESANSGRRTM